MPWLAVTGVSAWGAGRDLPWFKPGVYEVSEEIAEIARRDAPARVIVSEVPLELAPASGPPLTLEDIRVGTAQVRLAPPDEPGAEPPPPAEPERVLDTYSCLYCARDFPNAERYEWHVTYAHSVRHTEQVETVTVEEQSAEPSPEEADWMEQPSPEQLAPWERPGV